MARDADPWVTRHNLDGFTRMIVTQFSSDFSAVYDANHCRLHQVWPGKIYFGAVPYAPPMNPSSSKSKQPQSGGDKYFLSKNQHVWSLSKDGSDVPLEVRLGGYRFFDDYQNVTFWFELTTGDGETITVEETPDGGITEGKPWMERKINITGLTQGQTLELDLEGDPSVAWSVSGEADVNGITCSFTQNGKSIIKAQWNAVLPKQASQKNVSAAPLAKTSDSDWKETPLYTITEINGIEPELLVGGMTSLSGGRIAVSTWDNIGSLHH